MAAGPARFIEYDDRLTRRVDWQLLKAPTAVQTAVTAAKLSQSLKGPNKVDFAQDFFDFADVSLFKSIQIQFWGTGAADDDPIVQLYGWSEFGPGMHIGTVTAKLCAATSQDKDNAAPGWHTNPELHPAMKAAFVATTDYLACDSYLVTADHEQSIFEIDTATTPILYAARSIQIQSSYETDFPGHFVLDLSRSGYKYLCAACTDLDNATSLGAIFRPICMR